MLLADFIDISGFQLKNYRVHNITTDPSVFGKGHEYFNTTSNQLRISLDGSTFSIVATQAATLGTTPKALQSDANGQVALSTTTATELGYVAGVTSAIQTQLNGKEPTITSGTTAQYWRGDKSFQDFATAVRASVLTGWSQLTGSISATDTVLQAFGRVVDLGSAQNITAIKTFLQAPAANTAIDAIILSDTTAASSGNQQFSPAIHWSGQGWKTNATAASQTVEFRSYVIPTQGAANPTGHLIIESQINGGGYGGSFSFSSSGGLSVGSTTEIAAGIISAVNGFQINAANATSGHYLRGDGTKYVDSAILAADLPGSFSGFANPSASIGLTANNGSATTAMRSDATPALSQAIIPTWTGIHTFLQAPAANTSIDGVVLSDTTAASAANQQYSPRLRFVGQGWKTNATAASQTVEWFMQTVPVQGTANPTSYLDFQQQVNGGGYSNVFALFSSGAAGLGSTTDPGTAGVFNVSTGFRIANGAASGNVLRGNGTNFVSAPLAAADLSNGTTGTTTVVLSVSPALTGTPTAPTATVGTNTTQIATTAYVLANTANPSASVGLAAVNGSATTFMRSDAAPALSVSIAPTWTGIHTYSQSPAANTSGDGIVLTDPTAATAGNQQYSPRIRWTAQGWKTNATAGSQTVDWFAQVVPVQGAANPTSYLDFQAQINGAGYNNKFTLFSSGGAALGSTTDPGNGVLNVATGFQVGGSATTGRVLRGNGTNFVMAQLAAADLSDGTTGTTTIVLSASPALTGTPTAPTAAPGTNTTQIATTAFVFANSLSNPMTTLGDIIYGASGGAATRLGANSSATKKYLQSVSSAIPSWAQIAVADLSDGTTGTTTIVLSASPALTGTPTAPTAAVGTNTTQIATTAFVLANGIDIYHAPVKAVATSNINTATNGLAAVDGYTPSANDRILLTNQTTGSQNGIWLAQSGAWTRPTDYPAAGTAQAIYGLTVEVLNGTVGAGQTWYMTTTGAITIDTTTTAWSQESVSLNGSGVTGTLGATNGGTSFNTYTLGDMIYSSATNTLAKLAGNTTTTKKYLNQTGNGSISAAPVWSDFNADVIASTLTGFVAGSNTAITAANSILQAFQNAQGQINTLAGVSHTQNTDVGTSSSTFYIGTGGPKLKNNGGVLEVRNNADSAYADLTVQNLTVRGTFTETIGNVVNLGDTNILLNQDITTQAGNADGGFSIKRLKSDNTTRVDAQINWSESNKWFAATYVDGTDTLFTKRMAIVHTATIGDGATNPITVTHNLQVIPAIVQVQDASTGQDVYASVTGKTSTTVTISFGTIPTTNQYKVIIIG